MPSEQVVRLTVLEALYTRRRLEPDDPGIFWLDLEKMMGRPRVHLEEGKVHVEGGNDPAEVARLESRGYDLLRWRDRNLFFGGAAGVELLDDGTLAAAGDPRRGGHGVVVA